MENSDSDNGKNLIEGKYSIIELLDVERLEYFFNLFTSSTGFTASLILYPDHCLLIKSGCRKLCRELQCLDPESARQCVTEDLLLDSEIREENEILMRISSIGLADGAIPVMVRGVQVATIISGHVFLEKPDPEVLLRTAGEHDLDEYLKMIGGISHIPVVTEEALKASLLMLRDITVLLAEQSLNRRYEEESKITLKNSEQFFRGIAESIPGVIYRFFIKHDGDMGLSYVSERAGEILGIENNPADFLPRVVQLINPEDRERFIASVRKAVDDFTIWDYETKIKTPSGDEKYIHGISHPSRSGDEVIFNGVLLDVTARRKAEESLRESEARYREIFEDATVGIYQSLPEGRYKMVNRAFAEIGGYETPEQMIKEVKDIAAQHYVNQHDRELLIRTLAEKGHAFNHVIEFMKRDGTRVWGNINAVAVKDTDGKILYYHGTFIDITDRKKTEDALRLSEERYRMIADFTGQLIYDRDIAGDEIQWSGHSESLCGYTHEELNKMGIDGWRSRICPDDIERVESVIDLAGREQSVFTVEYRFMKADRSYMQVEESGGFTYNEEGNAVRLLGVVKDITDRVLASEEKMKLERQFLYAQKMESLGIMAGGIAHDFNNLLMGIMGSMELAMIETGQGSTIYKNLKRGMAAAKRAADITGQMLAYSGRGHFVMSQISPSSLLEGMSGILRSAVNRSIDIRIELQDNLPEIQADTGQFQQMMMNLITNSSEAIGNQKGEIVISAGAGYFSSAYFGKKGADPELEPGEYLYIDVADTGCGINEDVRKKLFDPFFSTKQTGRGMGLPAVQGIMKGHGGTIIIESEAGNGSKVRALFPVFRKQEMKGEVPAHAALTGKGETSSRGLVLVVDDEEVVRELCIEFVRLSGLDAIGAEDGEKGVEIFRRESGNLSCVLLDLSMPRMDGVTAFREIRKIDPDIPVILCSGYSEEDATRSFKGEKLSGFLQKPYKLDVLRDKILSILNNK